MSNLTCHTLQRANWCIDLRRAFIVYLLSHGRPMPEVLAPTRKLIQKEFLRGLRA